MKENIHQSGHEETHHSSRTIELFVQAEGVREPQLLELADDSLVKDVIAVMQKHGLAVTTEVLVLREDDEEELPHNARLKDLQIGHRHRLHCGRCRRVTVSVAYNGLLVEHHFSISATLGRVKRWADKQFGEKGYETADLQIQLSNDRAHHLDGDTHLGSLLLRSACELAFELRPKGFVQG